VLSKNSAFHCLTLQKLSTGDLILMNQPDFEKNVDKFCGFYRN
jgi:hypothetical protein